MTIKEFATQWGLDERTLLYLRDTQRRLSEEWIDGSEYEEYLMMCGLTMGSIVSKLSITDIDILENT